MERRWCGSVGDRPFVDRVVATHLLCPVGDRWIGGFVRLCVETC